MIFNNEKFRVLGIIGDPLRQSMSPILHNYWMKKYNINAYYAAFPIKKLTNIKVAIKTLNILGLNVTIPYKKKVIPHLDYIEESAKKIEAINTILFKKGKIRGYNTDVYGFGNALEKKYKWNTERPALIFGAGGSAEAVINYISKKGIKNIYIINRTEQKVKKIARKYKIIKVLKNIDNKLLKEVGLLVNTTSQGMIGSPELKINLKGMNKEVIIYDIVYNPIDTGLIKAAKKEKLNYITGLDMFIEQAMKSFEIWFNIKPEIDKKILVKIKREILKKW